MAHPPTEPLRPRWMNYYGPPSIIPFHSFYQLSTNTIPVEAISNKVVFIGARYSVGFTGGIGTDNFRTPYTLWTGRKSPGVEISATAYLNLLRGDWLTELPRAAELILVTILGALLGFGLNWLPPLRAAPLAIGSMILISVGAIVFMWQRLLWFPWLIPVAVQAPLALFWSVLVHTGRLRREKQELQVKLAAAELRTVSAEALAGQSATVVDVSPTEPPLVIPDHTLVRPIGKGAYGEVWLAKDIIGSFHAVKVVYRNKFKDGSPFEREFRGIQKFTPISRSHPGFVNILHVGRNDVEGYFYYIMELGDNENGVQKIDPSTYAPKNLLSELQRSGRLPAEECFQIAINLASALQHLHRHQLIHRDIKPSNIIFVNGVSKFADIGLVTEMAGGGRETTYVGTEGYIAPEGPGTAAADVYSLGKLLYEISTGLDRERFPELPTDLISGQPENLIFFRLNKIIVKACEANVSKRFQSAADLHEELLKLQKIPLHNE